MKNSAFVALAISLATVAGPAMAQDANSIIRNLDNAVNNPNQGQNYNPNYGQNPRSQGSSGSSDNQAVQQQVRRLSDQQLRNEYYRVDDQLSTLSTEQRALSEEMSRRNIRP